MAIDTTTIFTIVLILVHLGITFLVLKDTFLIVKSRKSAGFKLIWTILLLLPLLFLYIDGFVKGYNRYPNQAFDWLRGAFGGSLATIPFGFAGWIIYLIFGKKKINS